MKKAEVKNGKIIYRDMTAEEISIIEYERDQLQQEYWRNISYKEAVNTEIRKRYTIADELAIQRQRDEKPDEYSEYFQYCEQCKAYVKAKKGLD